jgi:hypothetical protein
MSKVLRRWSDGARRWNWCFPVQEKGVAAGPGAGQSSTLDPQSTQQPSAAPVTQQWRRRLRVRCIQGRALTKEGPWRQIRRCKSIICHPSTTLKARIRTGIQLGLFGRGPRGRSDWCRRPKGVGCRGVARGAAAPAKAVRLVGGGPSVDARSMQRGCSPSLTRPSPCTPTTTSGARPATEEEEERGEHAGPAQTRRPPSQGPEHGGNTQEQARSTRLSTDRPLRRGRAGCTQAGPGSQQQGGEQRCASAKGIARTDPMMVSATTATRIRALGVPTDSKSSGGKSSPDRRGGRGGCSGQRGRGRVALRDGCVGEAVRQQGTRVAVAAVHLFLHGHTSARPLVSDCGAADAPPGRLGRRRLCERAARAGSVLEGSMVWLPVASPRRGTPLPPTSPCSAPAGGGQDQRRDFLGRLLDQSDTSETISTTTRDTDTGPIQTSRAINNLVLQHFSASASSFCARGRDVSVSRPWLGMGVRLRGGVGKTGFPHDCASRTAVTPLLWCHAWLAWLPSLVLQP